MSAPGALTDQDVAAVRAAAAEKAVTVWFTAAAVGVPAGGSAKVVAVGDPADGDFIQVRPAGSRDTMFCSPNELTRVRPPRRKAVKEVAKPAPPVRPTTKASPAVARGGAPAAARKAAPAPAAPGPAPVGAAPVEAAVPAPAAPDRAASRRRRNERPGGISVSLSATAEGEWSVAVLAGTKRVVAPLPVPPADVAAAARSLPPAVRDAVEKSLEHARQRQRDRVAQLRAELDAAQRTLDELGD